MSARKPGPLTERSIQAMRAAYARGETTAKLVKRFRVSTSTVWRYVESRKPSLRAQVERLREENAALHAEVEALRVALECAGVG